MVCRRVTHATDGRRQTATDRHIATHPNVKSSTDRAARQPAINSQASCCCRLPEELRELLLHDPQHALLKQLGARRRDVPNKQVTKWRREGVM